MHARLSKSHTVEIVHVRTVEKWDERECGTCSVNEIPTTPVKATFALVESTRELPE